MPSAAAPTVTFQLPSGHDTAQRIAKAAGVEKDEARAWSTSDEASEDFRSTLAVALYDEFGAAVDAWEFLPRHVEYAEGAVTVTLIPVLAAYPDGMDVEERNTRPEGQVLHELERLHQEEGAESATTGAITQVTPSLDKEQVKAALRTLQQEGEVYQPREGQWRMTSARIQGED